MKTKIQIKKDDALNLAVDRWLELALLTLEHKKLKEIKKRKNGKRI